MQLTLDHTQRLNLHLIMGAQRGTVDEVRFWWRLQDQIQLDEKEKEAIHYRTQEINGVEQSIWDIASPAPPRKFEFNDEELTRIEKIVREWQPGFMAASDRRWLEPLLAQFPQRNGQPAASKPN